MSQHSFTIANQSAPTARADINLALKALASVNSGPTAPSTTYANMFWYDTTANQLKMRNNDNSGWITFGSVDQALGRFDPNQTFASSSEAIAGTNTTRAMTPFRVNEYVNSKFNLSGASPVYGCRAFVRYDAITQTIRRSGNVSSFVYNSVGNYTVNFTTPVPDGYCFQITTGGNTVQAVLSLDTSFINFTTRSPSAGTLIDPANVCLSVFG